MIERIVPIVEGHGEVSAVPVLLRRLLLEMNKGHIQINQPDRNPRSTLVQPGGIEFAVQRAADNAGPSGAILVLLDSDDDPPCVLGPQLMQRAVNSRSDRRVMIALAEVEFETWFLASAESLAGKNRLSSSLARPENFEKISGCQGMADQANDR